jgi:hypothetical protein
MKVNAGRILVLGFSTLLLISATYYLIRFWGIAHALFGMVAIITLPFYTTLSVSVMIGLPSIALALVSFVSLVVWQQDGRVLWMLTSAIFLALSVMTKIWTIILVPIFLMGIFWETWNRAKGEAKLRSSVRQVLTWFLVFAGAGILIALLCIRPRYIPQLVSTHLAASGTDMMQLLASRATLNSFLDDSIPLFLLSLFGAITAIRTKTVHALYLVAWVLVGYLLLVWIVPNWHHHQLLITIPAALLASIALGTALTDLVERMRSSRLWTTRALPAAAIALVFMIFAAQRVPRTLRNFRLDLPNLSGTFSAADQPEFEIVAIMTNYANGTSSVFTDRPMYAFRSGMQVHPDLAVITEKRYITGDPSQEKIYDILMETMPEQVILGRFNIPAVLDYMETRNFIRVDSSLRSRHYMRADIYEEP